MNKTLARLLTCMIFDKQKRKAKRRRLMLEGCIFSPNDIKLFMTLVVKDEEELIETNIRFHHAMGVDGFIVTDNNSTDNTRQILEKLKAEGLVFEIITEKSTHYEQNIWVDRMIKLAKNKYKANWVINADADEFYYSKDLNLKVSIFRFPMLNAIKTESTLCFPTDKENVFDNVYFLKNPLEDYIIENLNESDKWLKEFSLKGAKTCPKVMHQTRGYEMIAMGNHSVQMKDLYIGNNVDIILYHYHIVNYRRYAEKAKRWAASGKYLTKGENYLTKLTSLLQNGGLRQDYDSKYGIKVKEKLEAMGVISKDYSVYNFLKFKGIIK